MEWLVTLVLVALAATIGYLVGQRRSPDQEKFKQLENLVLEKEAESEEYKEKVAAHFEKSSELFSKVTNDYQALYEHMAKTSQQLSKQKTFKPALEANTADTGLTHESHKEDTSSAAFNTDTFYNAHEYRNQDEQEPEETPNQASADIIQLDAAREDSEQPLDYAIKAKGVINHNSLEQEDVQKS
ncbi:YhcB family protein [Pleionea sp. CnH1-48]|uniref:YhcB family protein n=1 Tax=Pleionea sp. CnH1-48 TaxID=2954494 RepID=UPI00209695C0|nr:DUF1043 family protein [Pleionea sp. CnH1-48]MCO7224022.1 YhcB family protein [Pleionea sp. CnH1-48]